MIVPAVQFSPTGMGNRGLVAGAIGVAMIFVSVVAWGSNAIPPTYRSTCFSAVVALVVFCGALRVATVSGFWIDALQSQQRVLRAARVDLREVPAGTTVILDGVCPYNGPAPVFETGWDVSSALSVAVGRWFEGDTVSPRMRLTTDGLQTSFYDEAVAYPYGPRLVAYNPNLHLAVTLRNLADARHFFARPERWPRTCHRLSGLVYQRSARPVLA